LSQEKAIEHFFQVIAQAGKYEKNSKHFKNLLSFSRSFWAPYLLRKKITFPGPWEPCDLNS